MNYPFWDTAAGYGLLMAGVAVIHVFVSHFAIGGGLYLVLAERAARAKADTLRLAFLERLSKFFVLVTVVFGALTGVGIWFIIGLLNPAATEVLIHNFVWGWATEWTFFVIELLSAVLYYYGWRFMSAKSHMILGWIYFWAAWISLVIINGIITFMLTPGRWIETGAFWDGFFNPTYWPSLVLRTGVCIAMAGLFAMAVAAVEKPPEFRAKIVRYNAVWGIVGTVMALAAFVWYRGAIPAELMETAKTAMPFPLFSAKLFVWLTGALLVGLLFFGLAVPRSMVMPTAILLMLLGLGWFGSYEFFREGLRKPYVIGHYMYGNAVEVSQLETLQADGMLAHMPFRTGNDGADLFRRSCRSCHTVDGYKALKPHFDGTDPDFIAAIVRGTKAMRGNMPPFAGTGDESRLIAGHIYASVDHRSMGEIYGLSGEALGRKVYDVRCGVCHVVGGYDDKTESLASFTETDLQDLLASAGDLAPEMPDFTGSDADRAALIEYLKTFNAGGAR